MYVNDLAFLSSSVHPPYFLKIVHHRISKLDWWIESQLYILQIVMLSTSNCLTGTQVHSMHRAIYIY